MIPRQLPIIAPLQLQSHQPQSLAEAQMAKIHIVGRVDIPAEVTALADLVKKQHYKVNTPAKFTTHTLADKALMEQLSELVGVPVEKLNYVYFSACGGAEPHTDLLDPEKFTNDTYVIPVILPPGAAIIKVEEWVVAVKVGMVYKFDHTCMHSMELEDTESGCTVIMVAVRK